MRRRCAGRCAASRSYWTSSRRTSNQLAPAVAADVAAELVAAPLDLRARAREHAPLDLDVLAALVAIALVAAVVAELEHAPGPRRRQEL